MCFLFAAAETLDDLIVGVFPIIADLMALNSISLAAVGRQRCRR